MVSASIKTHVKILTAIRELKARSSSRNSKVINSNSIGRPPTVTPKETSTPFITQATSTTPTTRGKPKNSLNEEVRVINGAPQAKTRSANFSRI